MFLFKDLSKAGPNSAGFNTIRAAPEFTRARLDSVSRRPAAVATTVLLIYADLAKRLGIAPKAARSIAGNAGPAPVNLGCSPNCLVAERCWDQARWAIEAYAWR